MEQLTATPLWSRRRLLRGTLAPAQAVVLGVCATVVILWMRLLLGRLDAVRMIPVGGESSMFPDQLAIGSLTAPVLVSAVVLAPLAVAAFVDSVCHLLPDPLLLIASLLAVLPLVYLAIRGEWSAVVLAALTSVVALAAGLVLSSVFAFGRGDAKLLAVLGLWLGSPTLLLAGVTVALMGAGAYAIVLMLSRRATRTTALALGPWLVGGASILWAVGS